KRLRRGSGALAVRTSTSAMADPRVDDGVEHVDDEVHDHDHGAGEHRHPEDHGVVAAVGGLDRDETDARVVEQGLDYEGSGTQYGCATQPGSIDGCTTAACVPTTRFTPTTTVPASIVTPRITG